MPNTTKLNHWRELFSQYRECGLTVVEFCQRHDVRVHQFYYWRAKTCTPPAVASGSALVPVHFPATATSEHTHEVCIRLPNGVEVNGLGSEQMRPLLPVLAQL